MLDSIYTAMSGLTGFQKGLSSIAANTTNLNTPGFKGSSLQFSAAFSGQSGQQSGGLQVGHSTLLFSQGPTQTTGRALDMAINGNGLFTLRDASGNLTYTREGRFDFVDGILVDLATGKQVMGLDAQGKMGPISVTTLDVNAGKGTTALTFSGNLDTTVNTPPNAPITISGVTVVDAAGGAHTLSVVLTNTNATTAGSWQVQLMDGSTVVGTGQLLFPSQSGPRVDTAKLTMTFSPAGQPPMPLTLDFSNTQAFASSSLTAVHFASGDGVAPGSLSSKAFDATGQLVLTYTNGQTVKGSRFRLARFDSAEAVGSLGGSEFEALDAKDWHFGVASGSPNGIFGSIVSQSLEQSNVDLSKEFSNLVLMQRGYQASSQVVSTANEMLQELFSMKGQ